MAVVPVNRVQPSSAGGQDPLVSGQRPQPAPLETAERGRRGQPTDQVVFSQEARDKAVQARPQQEDPVERRGNAGRLEFDRRQQETVALTNQSARAEERREADTADRGRVGVDVNA